MWKKTNKWGAICGAFGGQWLGLIAWVLYAKVASPPTPILAPFLVQAILEPMSFIEK